MCGVVGLHLRSQALEPRLGELLTPMLAALATRGPDSAGIALYADGVPDGSVKDGSVKDGSVKDGSVKYSLRAPGAGFDWGTLAARLERELATRVLVRPRANVATLAAAGGADRFLAHLRTAAPEVTVAGHGQAMEVYKDVGDALAICRRYGVPDAGGYQAVGHTRMATESAVTTDHSHPFAPAADLSLVHNGSFSNHASIRRALADQGVAFDTDNDSEVAARYVAHRMRQGDGLGDALRMVLKTFDGFFTLLVATRTEFAVVRDAFACKPAVIASSADYVAMASEYHALAGLPGIERAEVFEPMPEEIHLWSR
jgi:methylamine---glutamate N-methyltransferase subunit A